MPDTLVQQVHVHSSTLALLRLQNERGHHAAMMQQDHAATCASEFLCDPYLNINMGSWAHWVSRDLILQECCGFCCCLCLIKAFLKLTYGFLLNVTCSSFVWVF